LYIQDRFLIASINSRCILNIIIHFGRMESGDFLELLNWSHDEVMRALEDDVFLARTANDQRLKLPSSPEQSEFRVYALLLVKLHSGKAVVVEGSNAEQGYIGGAICAERAALVQLRRLREPKIMKVVVVTDSAVPIAPGLLCREFLSSHCAPDTPIVIANNFAPATPAGAAVDGSAAPGPIMVVKALKDIFPYPYAYRTVRRGLQARYAMDFCTVIRAAAESGAGSAIEPDAQSAPEASDDAARARERAREEALVELAKEVAAGSNGAQLQLLHPLQFGAACLFDDGSVETAHMLKGLEYGCTVDPVSLLIREMCLRRDSNMIHAHRTGAAGGAAAMAAQYRSAAAPVCLAMVDQFGVAHAPFAPARALLVEHGFEDCSVLYHSDSGALLRLSASELAPNRAITEDGGGDNGTRSLLCSDFFPNAE
jgi:cytidine deaminase